MRPGNGFARAALFVAAVGVAAALAGTAGAGTAAAGAGAATPAPEIMVYAAASLRDALQAIAPACETAAGARLVFNFAGSNDLARQILAAGKADIFLSADEAWMDRVEGAGLLEQGSRLALLSNRLVVIARRDSALTATRGARDLAAPAIRRIALADPGAVPAGRYARAWLESAGAWDAVAPRVLPTLDVRAALAAVVSGAADAGIVYATDAMLSPGMRVLYEVPPGEGPRIVYPMAILRDRPHRGTAGRVAACIAGPASRAVFERFGFIVVVPESVVAPESAVAPEPGVAPRGRMP